MEAGHAQATSGESTAAMTFRHAVPARFRAPWLPQLQIPTFKGDISQWTSFWEQFEIIIYLNSDLTPATKFYLMKSFVCKDAATAIVGLPMTESCYADAMGMLKERFADKATIIEHHLRALRNLPRVTSANDMRGL
ncbi:hypothetical protein HPB51_026656 [Rhipicephalus microplus]|uniref:Tick transposon n=1 Tax=Rhipicephalus microplus TaxID=6941 RepID=A0A9J6D2H7_RHIMP|nr:hypothetical protein HPB51_026656 [Rhipicephalus microplus]